MTEPPRNPRRFQYRLRTLFALITAWAVALPLVIRAFSPASDTQDLREAVRSGNVKRVKSLLDSGADVNTPYENQMTPIYFAESPEVVDLLLANGARLDLRDAASIQSPIERAAESYFRDEDHRATWTTIVNKLRAAGATYTIDTATYMNDVAFVEAELAKDSSWVNKRRGAQTVPLRVAARAGRIEICKLLLEHKADPDAFEEGIGYPIIVSAVDHPQIVKLLIDHGANLKRRITWRADREGFWIIGDEATALHFAASAGNLESVKLLIGAGLDPNAADNEGQTPLHIAIKSEADDPKHSSSSPYIKVVQCLLDNSASLRLTDKKGKAPLDLAEDLQSPMEIINAIGRKQEEYDKALAKGIHQP